MSSSSVKKSIRKYLKPSRYIRKFGTADKIQAYVTKYLDSDKLQIEHLLTKVSDFTNTAVKEYIRKNERMYSDKGPDTVIHNAFARLCRAYNENDDDDFFRITRQK